MKLSSLIGLSREKHKARMAIRACAMSGEIFPHTLLYGIGGTGKTAFARAIGEELNYHFVETHGAAFKKPDQLHAALIHYSQEAQHAGSPLLFFLDEIHRLSLPLQESLYSAMKEWWIPTDRTPHVIPKFTLIAATTRFDMLDANSFVTRFSNCWEIDRYPEEDIATIIAFEFDRKGLSYSNEVLIDIAKRCLGIPRIAMTLSGKVRTTTLASGSQTVTLAHTRETFLIEEIDEAGLDPVHLRYLRILQGSCTDGRFFPLGIGAISAKMRYPEDMVRGSVEPILLELDLVAPTPRGRILTKAGSGYLEKNKERS